MSNHYATIHIANKCKRELSEEVHKEDVFDLRRCRSTTTKKFLTWLLRIFNIPLYSTLNIVVDTVRIDLQEEFYNRHIQLFNAYYEMEGRHADVMIVGHEYFDGITQFTNQASFQYQPMLKRNGETYIFHGAIVIINPLIEGIVLTEKRLINEARSLS